MKMNSNKNLIIYVISLILIATVSRAAYTEFTVKGAGCDETKVIPLVDQCQPVCAIFGKIAAKTTPADSFTVSLYSDDQCSHAAVNPADLACKPNNASILIAGFEVTCLDTTPKTESSNDSSSTATLTACLSSILAFIIVGLLL